MKKAILRKHPVVKPILRVIRGFKKDELSLEQATDTAWQIAYSVLWNNQILSEQEINNGKQSIKEYFERSTDRYKAFLSFCQRVVLAKEYISKSTLRYIPLPGVWLDKNNSVGFAGTKNWYAELIKTRDSLPTYRAALRQFADWVLTFSENPTTECFYLAKLYLTECNEPHLFNLFVQFAANLQFNK